MYTQRALSGKELQDNEPKFKVCMVYSYSGLVFVVAFSVSFSQLALSPCSPQTDLTWAGTDERL